MAKKSTGLRFQDAGGSKATGLPVGKKQLLSIDKLANDGRGIGHAEGRTWFVAGALAGEQVEARVLAARSKVVDARVERVLQASPLRRVPACAVAGRCGGCTLQHLPHAEQLQLKQQSLAEQLQRIAGVQPLEWAAPLTGPELGYRRRARIAVRWDVRQKRLEVGFRAAASQDIVPIGACPVLVPELQAIAAALPALLQSLQRAARVGHVELFSGSTRVLLLRHTAELPGEDVERVRRFCAEHDAQLWWQGEGQPVPDDPAASAGFALDGFDLQLAWRPGDFVQVNAPINAAMLRQALDWLAPQAEERVLDLFCGLGNFALPLARRVREVVAVEGVASMVERARANALANGLDNLQVCQADLSQPLAPAGWAQGGFAAVLLDPPRDGALQVVRQMSALGAQRLVYVSCNPATLARDAAELIGQGYRLQRAGILDMFPQTAHVEAMALFARASA
ncbi:23S rRNA (uracil(1939)-C(5))-methyltransferase RlmD [Pseudomonas sp. N040]|uniref:23S rRNA (uracil(1939)-C(5))-methyltransferase RlmD n=1 Tax=Pseudomonas sp. N040 TaxID=2785325 RepID=UPI0018A2B439|nr:23S rRNA (uracil(1939)-C(5))-methyltransferase RlmD [Pseudomonas sp. N040]MBF7729827.1 23S rRNA (uracil(1939)-C(5))-methyltransferase RlmD [Pseudomonas sp. N040]MBW7013469.1 23S rRNA (uracil(1939)-C(5))-methyltransferase RlmD [Pseudomonas sp. N040]